MCDILRRLSSPALTKQQYLSSLNEFSRLCRARRKEELFQVVGQVPTTKTNSNHALLKGEASERVATPRLEEEDEEEEEEEKTTGEIKEISRLQNDVDVVSEKSFDTSKSDSIENLIADGPNPIFRLNQNDDNDIFTMDDVFSCLKTALFHDAAEVRAAALRAIRYLLKDETSVKSLLRVDLPIFIVRSIDIVLENRTERIQALRLVRKFLSLSPYLFPSAFTRSLIAIAQDGHVEHDALTRACWALLAELSIMNPTSSTKATQNCAFNAIMDAALAGNQPHGMCESLISTLLFMLNWPKYRLLIRGDLDLQIFVAPFTDSHYTAPVSKDLKQRINQTAKFDVDPYDQRENKFTAAKITLISILRSWQGLIYLCEPQSSECNLVSNSCLKSLINMLYLPYNDVRGRLIDLIFELLYLPLPESATDFESGLKFLEKHQLLKDSWKIHDAFVVDEAKAMLPPLRSRSRMNLVNDYMALLLVALFHCNVVDALSEVIITPSHQDNSTRATILLYQLLSLSYQYLPTDSFSQYLTLSTLIAYATSKIDDSRDLANAALMNLGRLHPLKKSNFTHTRCSLFLSQILEFCSPHLLTASGMIASNASPTSCNMSTTSTMNSLQSASTNHTFQQHNNSSSSSTSTIMNFKASSRSPSISSRSPSILSKSPSFAAATSILSMFSFPTGSKSNLKAMIEQDWQSWDWEHINFILTRPNDAMKKLSAPHYRTFIRRLVHFFKPSSNQYSLIEINSERSRQLCETGCNMVDFLALSSEPRAIELLKELLHDISNSMHDSESASTNSYNMNNSNSSNKNTLSSIGQGGPMLTPIMPRTDVNILSSSKLISTMSSTYFLFIGRLSSTMKGFHMLEKSSIMKLINNLTQSSMVATSPAEVYVRLIISCFDYTKEFNGSRELIEKFLFSHPEESVRIYATNFLRVLLRANLPEFSTWAMELLIKQFNSKIRVIHCAAADILDEACDYDDNLEGLVALKQVTDGESETKSVIEILRSNGDAGILLLSRYASSPNGLRFLIETPRQRLSCPLDSVLSSPTTGSRPSSQNFESVSAQLPVRDAIVKRESEFDVELDRWQRVLNYRYVKLVEDVLNNSLTYHQKGEDGKYGRRIDRINPLTKNSHLPPHLYGQLALHHEGAEMIVARKLMEPVYDTLNNPAKDLYYSEVSVLKFKAALWIIGHVGSSEIGYQVLDNSRELIKKITDLARSASVLSLRGTAFYVLGLLGSTEEGAEELKEYGWIVQKQSKVALPLDLDLILTKPQDDNTIFEDGHEGVERGSYHKLMGNGNDDDDGGGGGGSSRGFIESRKLKTATASKISLHPILQKTYSMSQLEQIRRDILKYVTNLSGSVASRPAENNLLNMKRKFGPVFQYDLGLYSEVCHQLARYNFRLHARRFLQELFLEMNYKY